jgi:hypothetical protein
MYAKSLLLKQNWNLCCILYRGWLRSTSSPGLKLIWQTYETAALGPLVVFAVFLQAEDSPGAIIING